MTDEGRDDPPEHEGSSSERRLVSELTRHYGGDEAARTVVDHGGPAVDEPAGAVGPLHGPAKELPLPLPPRYELLAQLGAGGMGVVLGVRDRQLDRPVALKLLGSLGRDAEANARLHREAKALAQLSHPNVVPVYDVGEHEGRLYLVMEWVTGLTLGQWRAARPRTLPEIVATYLQAGEGLAAAHAHGIVHRDFKPGNVLVGDDGRVRVVDFGLARLARTHGDDPITAPASGTVPELEAIETLTKTGLVMGTPAYMSPEQAEGREPGPASDQFSFCVALHEALRGWRPVRMGIAQPVDDAVRRAADTGLRVPARLQAAIERGLEPWPERRWPSMHALLRELRAATRSRARWALGLGLGVLGLGSAVVVAVVGLRAADDPCEGGAARMAEVWGAGPRQALQAGIGDAGVRAEVVARLDEHASEWTAAYGAVCREASARGMEAALLDQRMRCLEEQRRGVAAALPLLLEGTPEALARGGALVGALPPASACVARAGQDPMLPIEPERREVARRVRDGLEELEGMRHTQGREAALRRAEQLQAEAMTLGHPPLSAAADLRLGQALVAVGRFADARAPLERAFFDGRAAGVHDVATEAASRLLPVVRRLTPSQEELDRWTDHLCVASEMTGDLQARARCEVDRGTTSLRRAAPEAALEHVERALGHVGEAPWQVRSDALVLRANALTELGRLPAAEAAFAEAIASERARAREGEGELLVRAQLAAVHLRQGRNAAALEALQAVLAPLERELGPEHPDVGRVLAHTALALEGMGRDDEALGYHQRALASFERGMGSRSTDVAMVLGNLGQLYLRRNDAANALPLLERGLEVIGELHDESHPMVAQYHLVLGTALDLDGRPAEAVSHMERALRDIEAALGPTHTRVAEVLSGLGPVYDALGRTAEGEAALRRGLEIRRGAGQEQHVDTAMSQVILGRLLVGHGRNAEASIELESALASLEAQLGPDNPQLRSPLQQLARAEHGLGRHAAAAAHARRAIESYVASKLTAYVPSVRLTLAAALWDGRIDRRQAVIEAQTARAECLAMGDEEGATQAAAALRRFGKR